MNPAPAPTAIHLLRGIPHDGLPTASSGRVCATPPILAATLVPAVGSSAEVADFCDLPFDEWVLVVSPASTPMTAGADRNSYPHLASVDAWKASMNANAESVYSVLNKYSIWQ